MKSKQNNFTRCQFMKTTSVGAIAATQIIPTSAFDLTMSILTHNIYRLFALEMERYENMSVQSIYEKFIKNAADIEIDHDTVQVALKKKITFEGASYC